MFVTLFFFTKFARPFFRYNTISRKILHKTTENDMFRFFFILSLLLIAQTGFSDNKKAETWPEETLQKMSLDEKIGQLLMIAVYSNKDAQYEDNIEKTLKEYNIGGIIFFQGDPVRQVNMINRYQKAAKYPLLIGLDAEHGTGWRLKTAMEFPKMLINGAITNDSLIYELGATIARHCREIGVHINFAPDADINNNPKNPVIGVRSFGEDRENVYRKSAMYIAGSMSENVLPVAKHFPGHGDTDVDSHQALPIIPYAMDRLDSIELYPFKKLIASGLPAIMIAHLNVPALDPENRPASLSPLVIKKYLKGNLQFEGLCFTDAMNMKGVTQDLAPGEADVEALIAGNDILLFPADIRQAITKIKKAVSDGRISEKDIHEKCRKVLLAKHKYVLPDLRPLNPQGLWSRINTQSDFALKQQLYQNALTLIRNTDELLPLKRLDTLKIASVNFGNPAVNQFQTVLSQYGEVQNFATDANLSDDAIAELAGKLKDYNCIIIYNSKASDKASQSYGYSPQLAKLTGRLKDKRIILCHPAIPYGLQRYVQLPVDAILVSYEDHLYARQYAAQAIFGGSAITGKLPVGINSSYPAGTGITTAKTRLGYATPEMCHINSKSLNGIDSLCETAIRTKATPGCQVLIAKDGYIIYNKAFGFHKYDRNTPNNTSNIYDVASVTKITTTLPVIMKLYDEKKIDLDSPLSTYYPALQETNKKNITFREVLTHTAGLKAFIPSFADAINKNALPGRLFTMVPTKYNTMKLKDRLYVNPNYQFRDSTLARTSKEGYESVTPGLYIYKSYRDSVLHSILFSDLNPKKDYLYSDLGFILLQETAEQITGESIDQLSQELFFKKLGANNTGYLAAERLNKSLIVPSSFDKLYRKAELKGYVHDPTAALMGGIAGHAGLFSTAEDLAKIMDLYLNKGYYGGEQFFSPATVSLFTQKADVTVPFRRGLGFDKPESDTTKISPASREASASSFGHMGFTGTMVWCDPERNLIYIFLSNRTYPDEFNTKLSDENIRTKIQSIIYQAEKL